MQSMENTNTQTEEKVVEAQAEVAAVETTEQNKPNDDVGYGAFLGSELLLSIPVVGLIASIVMSIVSKKKSFKNFALSKMTWILAKDVLSIATVLLIFSIIGNAVVGTVNSTLGTNFDSIYTVVGTAVDLSQGKYSSSVAQLEYSSPDNLKPFVKELGTGKYEALLQNVKNEEYDILYQEFKSDHHPELIAKLDKETYDSMLKELEKAANGEQLPWMKNISHITEEGILSFLKQ